MRRAIAWFAENGVAANLLLVVIIVAGAMTLPTIRKEVFPEFSSDLINVSVRYRGAAPEEVESYCKKLIDVVGEGGGFILSSGCTVPVDCKIENLKAMVDTAKSYWPH